jgi:hypothetical protein
MFVKFIQKGTIHKGVVLGWSAVKSASAKQYQVTYLFDDGKEVSITSEIEWSTLDA